MAAATKQKVKLKVVRAKRSALPAYVTRVRDAADQAIFNEFGRRLTAAREAKNWNQSDLARRCEQLLPKPTRGQIQNRSFGRDKISHYERGISMPRSEAMLVIARALQMEPEDLLPSTLATAKNRRVSHSVSFLDHARAMVHINRAMSAKSYAAIVAILDAEDRIVKNSREALKAMTAATKKKKE